MSITITFEEATASDISLVNVYESSSSTGVFDLVYSSGITITSTYVTYESGSTTMWYKISFEDIYGNESLYSAAIYGGGYDWANYLIPAVRTKINDWGDTYTYSDDDLRRRIVAAGLTLYQMALAVCPFTYEYTFSIDNTSTDSWDIVPDPIYESRDNNFVNLIVLKTAADITQSSFLSSSSNAIKIKDGDTSIDTSASLGGFKDIMNSQFGAPYEFEYAWNEYVRNNTNFSATGRFGCNTDDWVEYDWY